MGTQSDIFTVECADVETATVTVNWLKLKESSAVRRYVSRDMLYKSYCEDNLVPQFQTMMMKGDCIQNHC